MTGPLPKPRSFRGLWAFLLCVALALVCGLAPLVREGDGRLLDQAFKLHQRLGALPARGPEVVIVGLDEASEKAIPEPLALYHRPLGRFMEAMAQARPAAVGLDIVLPEHSWDQYVAGLDGALGHGLLRLKGATHLVLGMTVGNEGAPRPVHPLFVTLAGQDRFAFVQVQPDGDRMVRRYDNRLGANDSVVPTLSGELARPFGPGLRPGLIHFALGRPFTYVPLGTVLAWLDQGDQGSLQAAFGGRIVLLGSVIPFEDRFRLPVRLAAWEDPANPDSPGVLLQAQIVRTLLAGASIRTLPNWSLVLLAGLGALLGLGAARRPFFGGPLLVLTLLLTSVYSYRLLDRGWFLPLTGLVAAAVLGFGARILADLIQDRFRKRAMEKELVWARIVAGKNEELQAANGKLQEAQSKIAELMDAHGNLLEDLPAWASATGREIQRTVGAPDLGIYELRRGQVFTLKEQSFLPAPEAAQIKAALQSGQRLGKDLVVPALGLSGEILGVLLVEGPFPEGSSERQLLQGFASQLGSALEMIQVRGKLVAAEGVRGQTLEDLHARGIATAMICPRCASCFPHTETVCPKDGVELELPGILPLHVLGRYRLLRRLGEGGMGTVYEAEDLTLKRCVAIKLMRPDLFRDPRSRLRFERETRTLVQAQHPHVVMVYDSGELEDGSACLIMERLLGMDLGQIMSTFGPGTPQQVAQVLIQAGEALDAAHRVRIVHRDIKPQNLFLIPSADGFEVKILDFGLAKFQEGEAKVTQTGFMMGTPAYMAPEQILGQDADERSDLFSFATVIYEILVGRAPLDRMEINEILRGILNTPPVPPSEVAPWLPPSVDAAFAKALAKDPGQRPGHVLAWARELAMILEGVEVDGPGWSMILEDPPAADFPVSETAATAILKASPNTHLGTRGSPSE
jgi:CHASE2 domain-containing sensor protein/tRNA A-37 threonylcarbamoyl transferase component Bud32